jgi:hypothetical protein
MPAHDSNERKSSPPRNAALALVAIAATALVLWATASRLGVWPASWRIGGSHAAPSVGAEHLPGGTLKAALELASAWVNGSTTGTSGRARTADAGAPRATLAVLWCDTDPDGLAALSRAEELREAYEPDGVRVIAIHAPDFSFATDTAVVARAARRAGARLEIALDPDGRVREKLGMTGAHQGAVLADSSGATLLATRSLDGVHRADLALREMLSRSGLAPASNVDVAAALAPFAIGEPIYLGVGRVSKGPLATASAGRATPFAAPFRFEVEGEALVPYPVGWWTPSADGVTASHGGAASFVALRYESAALAAVISPPRGGSTRVWILCDEHWLPAARLGTDARLDSRGASYVDANEPRLYEIVRWPGRHVIKLSPDAAGVTLHALVIEAHGSDPASH